MEHKLTARDVEAIERIINSGGTPQYAEVKKEGDKVVVVRITRKVEK